MCRCAIVRDVCVVCVSLCVPLVFVWRCVCRGRYVFDCVLLVLCVNVFVWVGVCLIVYFWGFGGGSLSHM